MNKSKKLTGVVSDYIENLIADTFDDHPDNEVSLERLLCSKDEIQVR
ncbi:hypothetical protein [Pseudoalteromonas sp. NBT06-2]|nr:hypothetical protein [Pseudoalteromonas sp. NBT06-2]